MRIIVLGSNSFAGSSFVNFSLNKGEKLIGLSRSSEKSKRECKYLYNKNIKNFHFIKADINKNLNLIKKIFRKNKKSILVDFAGQGMVAESWINPDQWFQTNLLSKIKLLEYLKKDDLIERYIRISTPEVYGSHEKKINESTSYNPSTPYALTHASIDQYLKLQLQSYKFPVTILRFSNFYGEFQPGYRIIPKTILSILNKQKLPLHGNGRTYRSFIYTNDFCSAIYKAIHSKNAVGEVFNVSSDESISIFNLIKKICDKMNYDIKKLIVLKKDRLGKDKKYLMNSVKANKLLKWKNKMSLDEGLNRTIEFFASMHQKNVKFNLKYIHKR